jgi:chromosome segregation ATPase
MKKLLGKRILSLFLSLGTICSSSVISSAVRTCKKGGIKKGEENKPFTFLETDKKDEDKRLPYKSPNFFKNAKPTPLQPINDDKSQGENQQLKEEVNNLKKEKRELEVKYNKVKYNIRTLKSKNRKLKEENNKLISNNKELIIEVDSFKKENQQLKTENEKLKERVNSMTEKMNCYKQQIEAVATTILASKDDNNSADQIISSLVEQEEMFAKEIEALKSNISNLNSQLTSENEEEKKVIHAEISKFQQKLRVALENQYRTQQLQIIMLKNKQLKGYFKNQDNYLFADIQKRIDINTELYDAMPNGIKYDSFIDPLVGKLMEEKCELVTAQKNKTKQLNKENSKLRSSNENLVTRVNSLTEENQQLMTNIEELRKQYNFMVEKMNCHNQQIEAVAAIISASKDKKNSADQLISSLVEQEEMFAKEIEALSNFILQQKQFLSQCQYKKQKQKRTRARTRAQILEFQQKLKFALKNQYHTQLLQRIMLKNKQLENFGDQDTERNLINVKDKITKNIKSYNNLLSANKSLVFETEENFYIDVLIKELLNEKLYQ